VASLLGVAGGEVLIPTLIVLFGADIKLAGSLFLALSLPTMLVGFTRYSRDGSFAVLGRNRGFVLEMAGSIVGAFIGGQLLGVVPRTVLLPMLAAINKRRSTSDIRRPPRNLACADRPAWHHRVQLLRKSRSSAL
jgi:uncharacterized membrane protein YfcA